MRAYIAEIACDITGTLLRRVSFVSTDPATAWEDAEDLTDAEEYVFDVIYEEDDGCDCDSHERCDGCTTPEDARLDEFHHG